MNYTCDLRLIVDSRIRWQTKCYAHYLRWVCITLKLNIIFSLFCHVQIELSHLAPVRVKWKCNRNLLRGAVKRTRACEGRVERPTSPLNATKAAQKKSKSLNKFSLSLSLLLFHSPPRECNSKKFGKSLHKWSELAHFSCLSTFCCLDFCIFLPVQWKSHFCPFCLYNGLTRFFIHFIAQISSCARKWNFHWKKCQASK